MIKEVINVPKWLITNFRPKTKLQCFVFARQHCCHYRQVWFQQPGTSASPTSQLFAHFRLSGSDAWWRAAKMVAVGSAHFSKMLFRNLRVTSRTLRPCFLQSMINISSLYRDSSPKNLSLITHPHVVPNTQDLRSSSEHKLRYFWCILRALWLGLGIENRFWFQNRILKVRNRILVVK